MRAKTAVFDGEIAYVMEDGRTDFQKLQNTLSGGADSGRLVYFVFDLLHYDGVDLTGEPLEVRKDKLRTILAGEGPPLKLGDHMRGNGAELFAQVVQAAGSRESSRSAPTSRIARAAARTGSR